MEFGPTEYKDIEISPENKWDFFEKRDKDAKKKQSDEEKETKKEKSSKVKKSGKEADSEELSPKNDGKENVAKESSNREKEELKKILAHEYVAARTAELTQQIETLQSIDPNYHAAVADLALMEEITLKIDNPESEVEPSIEAAYVQIMDDLESIIPVQAEADTEAELPLIPQPETAEGEPGIDSSPVITGVVSPTKPPATHLTSPLGLTNHSTRTESPSGPDSSAKPVAASPTSPNIASPREYASNPEKQASAAKRIVAKGAIGAFFIGRNLAERTAPRKLSNPAESVPISRQEYSGGPEQQIKRAEQSVRRFAVEQAVVAPNERSSVRKIKTSGSFDAKTNTQSQAYNLRPTHSSEAKPSIETDSFKLSPVRFEGISSNMKEAEAPKPNMVSRSKETKPALPKKPEAGTNQSKIEHLNTPDLLKVASNIRIDGKTVRQLFESNKIDYKGLTSIIKEALSGGNIKKAYKKHELGKEAMRGRAIEMRHDDPLDDSSDSSSGVNSDTVGSLIEQLRTVNSQTDTSKLQTNNSTGSNDALEISKQKAEAALKKRTMVNISVAAVAAVSVVAALALLIFG